VAPTVDQVPAENPGLEGPWSTYNTGKGKRPLKCDHGRWVAFSFFFPIHRLENPDSLQLLGVFAFWEVESDGKS